MGSALVFILLTVVFAVVKIVLEKRLAPLDADGLDRRMSDLAFTSGCSVYALFQNAGAEWKFSSRKIDQDFKNYLRHNQTPHYVNDYVRRLDGPHEATYQKILFSGGRPPYL